MEKKKDNEKKEDEISKLKSKKENKIPKEKKILKENEKMVDEILDTEDLKYLILNYFFKSLY